MKKLEIMKYIYNLFLSCITLFGIGCASNITKIQNTGVPSELDGAWLNEKCTCAGKNVVTFDLQEATTLIINGNLIIQSQIGRWKKPEWNHYCSYQEESRLTKISSDSYNLNTLSDRTFYPGEYNCEMPAQNFNRVWKILVINKSELKFESTRGCDNGPLICSYKRIEK